VPPASAARKRCAKDHEAAAWEQQHGNAVDPTEFEREILPLLQGVPIARLVQGTGLSLRYVSQIRRGERVPHRRHWQAFADAGLLFSREVR
jgi:hypothetical protein